ncbi:MAG: LrgB family protein [Bacteroidaceae bacterium]
MILLNNPIILLALTFVLYFLAQLLQRRTGIMLLNPILITVALIIILLQMNGVSYATYHEGGKYIDFLLKPAVVALGVPLYLQLKSIRKQLVPLIISEIVGCTIGVFSVVLIASFMGASEPVILSLAAKSVTTPIAMEVTSSVGGIPALTAVVVVCVGLLGSIFGFSTVCLFRVKSPIAQGLAVGTASHAMGTSAAMDISARYGVFASLGLILNGILTAFLTPTILHLLGYSVG